MSIVKSTKERIIEAAQRLMWANNYGSTSVDKICEEADVRKGSFYYYFGSKEELALEVLEDQWQFAKKQLLDPSFSNNKQTKKQFNLFFQKLSDQYELSQRIKGTMYGCPFGNFGGEMASGDAAIRDKLDDIFNGFHIYFRDSLEKIYDDEEQATRVADELLTYFEGMLLLSKIRDDAKIIKQMTPGALKLISE